jgi:hypothetical protein
MQSWCPSANKQNNASDKPVEERPIKSYTTAGEEYIRVKGIEVERVFDQNLYVAYVPIGIGLSEPDPVPNKDVLIRQGYAYV